MKAPVRGPLPIVPIKTLMSPKKEDEAAPEECPPEEVPKEALTVKQAAERFEAVVARRT